MNIVHKKIKPIKAKKLNSGDLFAFADDKYRVYMLLDNKQYINLVDGAIMDVLPVNESVFPVKASFVIEPY